MADIRDSITFDPRPEDIIEAAYWKTPDPSSSNIAKAAYEKALELFKQDSGNDAAARAWLQSKTTIKHVSDVVKEAQTKYETTSRGRKSLLRWLDGLSRSVLYYGQVLDTLAQHHPEYVALAWGAIKFVLTGIMHHGELLEKLAKTLTLIGDVLPEVELSADLYKIEKMEKTLGMMYFNIMLFFWRAFRWFNKSHASRFFGSFASPYELKYKDVVEKIKECSANIELIASGASRAEIRSVNAQVHLVKQDQQQL